MLTFLRKIRKSLIDTGSAQKYLLYAIGEIALVVIGILIALQINNWNEWRKERVLEKESLLELKMSISSNQERLKEGLERWKSTTESIKIITQVLDQNLPYADSLARLFQYAHQNRGNLLHSLDAAGYKALENRGFGILRNQKLRKEIVHLFENRLAGLATSNNQLDFDNSGFHYEYITQNFTLNEKGEAPNDFAKILNDPFYYSILKKMENSLERKKGRVHRFLERNQRVLQLIEEELRK